MEKRRLLLVVMLLATSGSVLAFKSKGTLKNKDGSDAVDSKGAAITWKWWNRPTKEISLRWRTRKDNSESGAKIAGSALFIPVQMAKEASLARLWDCAWNGRPKDLLGAGMFGTGVVTLGLGIGFYVTAKNEKVQDGVKKFVRGVRRSLSFRKKTPEKKTDASAIEA